MYHVYILCTYLGRCDVYVLIWNHSAWTVLRSQSTVSALCVLVPLAGVLITSWPMVIAEPASTAGWQRS
jgi:hypothetical protein